MKADKILVFCLSVLAVIVTYRVAEYLGVRIMPRPTYAEYVGQHGSAMYESVYQDGSRLAYWAEDDGRLRKVLFRNDVLVSEKSYSKEQLWRQQSTVKRFNAPAKNENELESLDPSIDRLEKR